MKWQCKICSSTQQNKGDLLKHYRLVHDTFQRNHSVPCPHSDCLCSFKTWNALHTHLSRYHTKKESLGPEQQFFTCQVCGSCSHSSEKEYFAHIGQHLKKHETVQCLFAHCHFKTNVYGTFASHKTRKHTPHLYSDFKEEVITHIDQDEMATEQNPIAINDDDDDDDEPDVLQESVETAAGVLNTIVKKVGSLLLKLESIYNVSSQCIDELVEELSFISSVASIPVIRNIVAVNFKRLGCTAEDKVIAELAEELCNGNPVSAAFGEDSPFRTAFKRKAYFKENFMIVEPVEYILGSSDNRSFQYIPILQSLQQVFGNRDIVEKAFSEIHHSQGQSSNIYKTYNNGKHYRENCFYSDNDLRISLILYVDDFEVCNPLGTSRKKHKITAVYFVLANLPTELRSSLTSIYLAVLSKAVDVKKFGYEKVLEPLLNDLAILEQEGVYIASLGKNIKGTVQCVSADNLGAHSISGLVESFSGSYICRFCFGQRSEFKSNEVRSGTFTPRTKETHAQDIQALRENPSLVHSRGVKKQCALTAKLQNFHFVSGYPPDITHDLFEGIVPYELALCFDLWVKKKYISLAELNDSIKHFPYKWSDRVNSPHSVPLNFTTRKNIGGNAHENWALLRFLPFIIGSRIPHNEPGWLLIMDLKDLVEVVVSPVHTEESIWYLDSKISEHRHRFIELFTENQLIPKHHFLEHYPLLMKDFGPLVALWTIRFEAKHSFFKRVTRHLCNFKNLLLSLSIKHQMMISYHFHNASTLKPALCISKISNVPLDVLHKDIKEAILQKHPSQTCAQLTNCVFSHGTKYAVGMILVYGSTAGLPDFIEIIQIVILQETLSFIVKAKNAWYIEHLRSFQLEDTGKVLLVEKKELADVYPLVSYSVQGKRMITLKRHICITE